MTHAIDHYFAMSPAYFAVLMVIATFGFVLSSTFGVGGALLLIPLLAQKMPAAHAVAISAPVMLVNNVMKSIVFRKDVDVNACVRVSALALPCAAVGAYLSGSLDDRMILMGVAVLIVTSIIIERGLERRITVTDRSLIGFGALTGIVSGICGAAGPPTAIGLRGYGLEGRRFVATVAVFAVLLQLVKLPGYVSAGVLPQERWPLAALLSTLALLTVLVAPRLIRNIAPKWFSIVLDGILVVTAAVIVVDVIHRSL